MAGLRTVMILIGALAVLVLGATPSAASSADAAPCHEAAAAPHGDTPAPTREPAKVMKAMGCCAACVVAPQAAAPPRSATIRPNTELSRSPTSLPDGLTLSPEPGPPRV